MHRFSKIFVLLISICVLSSFFLQPPVGLNLGNKAPEINQKGTGGLPMALSSLKGRMVYIDFWASWCGPCRAESSILVSTYKKYRDAVFKGGNGFEVYSVSLDGNPEAWKKAIIQDKLMWSYHVSDLQGWNNEAAMRYGVTSIPHGLLINGEGIIIRKNVRPSELDQILQQLRSSQ